MRKTHEEKLADYERRRAEALRVAESLPVESLTLEQAAALLPDHSEWGSYVGSR